VNGRIPERTRLRIEQQIRPIIESFALDMVALIRRAVNDEVARALEMTPGRATPIRTTPPCTLESYERMAILRALHEAGGNIDAAAETLRIGRSTIYRRMGVLGIPTPREGAPAQVDEGDPVAAAGEPVSLRAYERAALVRALAEGGGNAIRGSEVLGIGKSSIYRLLAKHGIRGPRELIGRKWRRPKA